MVLLFNTTCLYIVRYNKSPECKLRAFILRYLAIFLSLANVFYKEFGENVFSAKLESRRGLAFRVDGDLYGGVRVLLRIGEVLAFLLKGVDQSAKVFTVNDPVGKRDWIIVESQCIKVLYGAGALFAAFFRDRDLKVASLVAANGEDRIERRLVGIGILAGLRLERSLEHRVFHGKTAVLLLVEEEGDGEEARAVQFFVNVQRFSLGDSSNHVLRQHPADLDGGEALEGST